MKRIHKFWAGVVFAAGLIFILHAQETETAVQVQPLALSPADIQLLPNLSDKDLGEFMDTLLAIPAIAPADLPEASPGFWSLQNPSWAPLPANIRGAAAWPLANGSYLLDDLNVDYSIRPKKLSGGGMQMFSMDPNDPEEGEGTNYFQSNFHALVFTTNDLWLSITGKIATTAYLEIHRPWNMPQTTVFDLMYCTNLAAPIAWRWVLRTDPGQINLIARNAVDAQGFYRLAPPNDVAANSSLGTNFWVVFPNMHDGGGILSLYIASPVGATGTVTIPGFGITNAFSAAAGGVTNVAIDDSTMVTYHYDVVEINGIHITASAPVSVYGMYYEAAATAAFTCYPTALLGTNYCVMTREGAGNINYPSLFAIVATADDTTVTITPSPMADLRGFLWTNAITLQAGETYQTGDSCNPGDDVTGTWITSDKPVAVFAGANLAEVPDDSAPAANPLAQELLPVDMWGTQALALSLAGRTGGDSYRVLAAYTNTVVWTNGMVAGTNQAGQFLDLLIDGPVEFKGSQPIQVAQFANGVYFDHPPFDRGDPCEILLPPAGHYLVTNTVFTLPSDGVTGDFDENFLNLIVAQSAITNTLVDGSHIAATNFVAIGTSGYYGTRLSVTNSGVHTVSSSQPVGVQVYGFGNFDAYGYFGGVVK